MAVDAKIERILALYPDDCRPWATAPFEGADAFSGAGIWKIQCERGTLCLRRWPREHPTQERLEFIQAVLWHVDQEGFHRVPLPLETRHHHGYVWHEGHLWELTPWLPGAADYRAQPSPERIGNALEALALFHRAAATFPLPEVGPTSSPGIAERRERLAKLVAGSAQHLGRSVSDGQWPELAVRARRLLGLFATVGPGLLPHLERASAIRVDLQPCIRDVWHAHVLFSGDRVSGIVDFGGMRPENVAADIARLLGSMALDDRADWQLGLAAYEGIRPLSDNERTLVNAFDRSSVLLGGLQWLEWIYVEGRTFSNPMAVLSRLDEFLMRLEVLGHSLA